MLIRPYRPETLRGAKVFQKLGEVGLESVVVGEGHIAAVINGGKCVSVFDHGMTDPSKKKSGLHSSEPSPQASFERGGMKVLPQQDVLVLAEPNSVPICECLFLKNAALNTVHLVIIRRSGHVEMWDYRSSKWSHGVSMKLYTTLFGTIVSACIIDSGSLVYVEKGKSAMHVRTVTLTQGTVGLSSSLMGSTQKAQTDEVLAQLPLQDRVVVRPGPCGRVWVICPQSQILLVPLDAVEEGGSPPPTFALSACAGDPPPGPAAPGPSLRYTSYCHHPQTHELVLFDAGTGQLSIVGAVVSSDRTGVTDLRAAAAGSLAGVVAPAEPLTLCYLSPRIVGVLSKERLTVVDLTTGKTGWSSIPHGLARASQVTKGYTGPPLLVGACGIFQVKCDGILDPPVLHHGPPSARALHPTEIDWTNEFASIPEDSDAVFKHMLGSGGVGGGGGAPVLPGIAAGAKREKGKTQAQVLKSWAEAETPLEIAEAGERLAEHFNVMAPVVGQRPLPTRSKPVPPPQAAAEGAKAAERGKRKVRLVMPPVDGEPSVADDAESCDDLDVNWSNRMKRYSRTAVDETLWEAMHAAEAVAEEMIAALAQKPPRGRPPPPATHYDMFCALVAAGATGEEEDCDHWTPPTAPRHVASLIDAACSVLDELGLYSLSEEVTQLGIVPALAAVPLPPTLPAAALDVAPPAELLAPLAGREPRLPHALIDALPVLFDGMPHVVPMIALLLSAKAGTVSPEVWALTPGDVPPAQSSPLPTAGSPMTQTPSPAHTPVEASSGGLLKWVAEAFLPHLLPCAAPTDHPVLAKCRARAVCVLHVWCGETVRALAHACAAWDVGFLLAVLNDDDALQGGAGAAAAARYVLEHSLLHEDEFLERAALAGFGSPSPQPAAVDVMGREVAAALPELKPLAEADWLALRDVLWKHVKQSGCGTPGAEVPLLNLLNANPFSKDDDDEVVDVYAALKDALSSFLFGQGFTEDVNAATAATLDLMAAEGGHDDFLKMIVEEPLCWDSDRVCFAPYLDKNRAHHLQSHILALVEPTPSLRSQYLPSASLSMSDTPSTPRTECDSPPAAVHAHNVPIYAVGGDPHPLAVPLKNVLPLLGIDISVPVP